MRQDEERGSRLPFDIVKATLKFETGSDGGEVPVPNLAQGSGTLPAMVFTAFG